MRDYKIIICLFVISLITRIAPVWFVPEDIKAIRSDSLEYNELAKNVLTHKGYIYESKDMPFKGITAHRTPGYPMFLMFVYKVFGVENFDAARTVQAVILSFIPVLLFLTVKLFLGTGVALVSGIIGVLYKPFIILNFYGGPVFLLSENLVVVTFLAAVYFYLAGMKKNSPGLMALAGLFFGITALVRPLFLLFTIFPVMLIFWDSSKPNRERIKYSAILIAASFIVIMPWLMRNYLVFNKVSFSTQFGKVLYAGNNPSAKGGWGRETSEYMDDKLEGSDEFKANELLVKEALIFIRGNFKTMPGLLLKKVYVAFQPFYYGYEYNFSYAFILPLFLISFFIMRENLLRGIFLSALIYYVFISLVFFGDARFRYPFEALFIAGASYVAYEAFRSSRRNLLLGIIAVYLIMNLFIYLNWDKIWSLLKK